MTTPIFKVDIDTVKRVVIVIDLRTKCELIITQEHRPEYFDNIGEDDTDGLVEFANDLGESLTNGDIALDLQGDSTITFYESEYPVLRGGVYLRDCQLSNPYLYNVSLFDVKVPFCDKFTVNSSTIEHLEWSFSDKVTISHCFINDKYHDVRDRLSVTCNEWFMNQRVDGEMW